MRILARAEASYEAAGELGARAGLHLTILVGLVAAVVGTTGTLAGLTSIHAGSVLLTLAATTVFARIYLFSVFLPLVWRRRTELYFVGEAVSILRSAVDVFD